MDEDLIVDGEVGDLTEDIIVEETKVDDIKDVPKYTEADVDRIKLQSKAKWKKEEEKRVSEAKKLAEMDAQQKAEFERDQLQAELEELREAKSRSEMLDTARSILKDKKLTIDSALLEVLVVGDAEKTKENIEGFATMFKKAVDAEVLERIKNPNSNKKGTTSSVTKESILAIKDTALRQAKIAENIHLFQ